MEEDRLHARVSQHWQQAEKLNQIPIWVVNYVMKPETLTPAKIPQLGANCSEDGDKLQLHLLLSVLSGGC